MKTLIIEDEPNAVRQLIRLLGECDKTIQVLDHTDSISASVRWLKTHPAPDLIFMDIQLADGISFEIFEQIEVKAPIIFCTAYDKYAIQAFQVNSIDYLLKPLDIEALYKSLEKFKKFQLPIIQQNINFSELIEQLTKTRKETKSRFLVKTRNDFISISVENIACFYIEHKIVNLVTLEAVLKRRQMSARQGKNERESGVYTE